MLTRTGMTLVLAAGGLMLTGCATVSQDRYDSLLTTYRSLQEDNTALRQKVEEGEAANGMLQQRLTSANGQLSTLEQTNRRLQSDLAMLESGYGELERSIGEIKIGPLPNEVNLALQRLASQHPGLLTYDASLGMVRFSSDLSFDLGSADLKPDARTSIKELASILNDGSISAFEIKLVGHTDSVPIKNAATRAKHPTNTYLSVHRAISVSEALIAAGIASDRVQVAGYGSHRPLVAEGPGGAPENRRVEMYLVPMTTSVASVPGSSGSSTSAAPTDEPMK